MGSVDGECICGAKEFITKPNKYNIFHAKKDILIHISPEISDMELKLFYRECGEELVFNQNDVYY